MVSTEADVTAGNPDSLAASVQRPMSIVAACGRAARTASGSLAKAPDDVIDAALTTMSERLIAARADVIAANEKDLVAAASAGISPALRDRLRLDETRLDGMATQLRLL